MNRFAGEQANHSVSSINGGKDRRTHSAVAVSALALLAGTGILFSISQASAQVCSFIDESDSGAGTFRQCVIDANTGSFDLIQSGIAGSPAIVDLQSAVFATSHITIGAMGEAFMVRNNYAYDDAVLVLSGGNILTIGEHATIKTVGTTDLLGDSRDAILVSGSGNTVLIDGTLTSDNYAVYGVHMPTGENVLRVRDGGLIETYNGIRTGGGNTINIDAGGRLVTAGSSIWVYGADNKINVAGEIYATGSGISRPFGVGDLEITVAQSGVIEVEGHSSVGVWGGSYDDTINILGKISAGGQSAQALRIDGSNGTTHISGTLEARGPDSRAMNIQSTSTNNLIVVSGTLEAEGLSSRAINIEGNSSDNRIVISGNINAEGDNSQAIRFRNDTAHNRLELHAGYHITGLVENEGNASNRLVFGGEDDADFDLNLLGSQFIGFSNLAKNDSSAWTLTGDGSGFTGTTRITGGILNVTNSLSGTVYVGPGTLAATGKLGTINVSNGGILAPGVGGVGTLTVDNLSLAGGVHLNFDLGTPGASDLIVVKNDLTLNGTLNVTNVGGFGNGDYTLIQYGNLIAGKGLDIGTMPDPDLTYVINAGTVDTGAGAVILTVSGGAAGANQYWDGPNVTPGTVEGGSGVWNAENTNWTDGSGNANDIWGGQFAIFRGATGTVTVKEAQAFTGMQFLTDGYTIEAAAGGELVANLANTNIRIASDTATISAPITGTGGLVKQEGGTLVLVGDNDYAGDTRIMDGILRVEGGAALGQGAVSVDGAGGLLDVAAGGVVDGLDITVNAGGAGLGARLGNGSSANGATLVANGGGIDILAEADITDAHLGAHGSSEIWVYFDTTSAQTHTISSLGGDGGIRLNGNSDDVLVISSGTESTFAGVISGDAGLTKTGVGALTLTGENTYTGLTTLQGGAWLYLGDGGEGGSIAGDVQIDSGVLYFNRSDDFTFAGQIAGTNSAHLRQNGAGTTTLTGDNSGFNGNSVIVSAGGLVIADGSTLGMGGAGIVNVQSGGALGGRGTIVTPTLNVNGRLAPGEDTLGTLTVTGDVNFGADSVFAVRIASNGDNDALAVTGEASLAGNVEVTAIDPHVSYVDGQTYTILTATDPLVGEFAGATMLNQSAFLTPMLTHNADNVVLTIGVTADFTTVAQTFNQLQVSSALNGLEQTGDALTVFNEIAMLGPDQARRAFDLTSGEVHASGQHVIDNTFALFNRTLRHQGTAGLGGLGGAGVVTAPLGYAPTARAAAGVGAIDDATAAYADSRVANAWLAPLGGRGTIDGDGNAASLDWWNAGIAGGYEGQIDLGTGNGFAGFGLGYIRSHGSVDARLSSFDADGFHIGTYGAWEGGPWRLAGALAYAANRISTERNIVFGGLDRTAEADYWTHSLGFSGEAAYGMDMGGGTTFLPLFTLDGGWSGHGGFTETGAGALNVSAGSESWTRLDTGIGLGISHVMPTEAGRLVLEGRAVWEHAFADVVPSQSLSFAGSPVGFDVRGPAASRDRLRIGAGLAWDVAPDMTVRANYDGLFSGDQSSHSGSIGLNIRF